MKKNFLILIFWYIFTTQNIFTGDHGQELTAPPPPSFEKESTDLLFTADFIHDFLEQLIEVSSGLMSTKKITIEQDWQEKVQRAKEKYENDFIGSATRSSELSRKEAQVLVQESFDDMLNFLMGPTIAQVQFFKLYKTKNPGKDFTHTQLSKKYEDFLLNSLFKKILVDMGMQALNFQTDADLLKQQQKEKENEKVLFGQDLINQFLNSIINVRAGLMTWQKRTIENDWFLTVQKTKDDDQEKNNTQNTQKNAQIWVVNSYDKMIDFLLNKSSDATRNFVELFETILKENQAAADIMQETPNFEDDSDPDKQRTLFAHFQYKKFIESNVFKDELFKRGMKKLGYHSTISFSGDNHPDEHKTSKIVPRKSLEDRAKNKERLQEIDKLEKQILEQQQQVDAFNLVVDERSGRVGNEMDYLAKIHELKQLMDAEEAKLNQLKEIVEPEQYQKTSGWSIVTNQKAVEILNKQSLDKTSAPVITAAENLLGVKPASSSEKIEKAFENTLKKIAKMNDVQEQELYAKAAQTAKDVLEEVDTITSHKLMSEKFHKIMQKMGITIAQNLLKNGKSIQEMMQDSSLANVDWSDDEIAYAMGYVQSCMWQLQQSQTKVDFDQLERMIQVTKSIYELHQTVHG